MPNDEMGDIEFTNGKGADRAKIHGQAMKTVPSCETVPVKESAKKNNVEKPSDPLSTQSN